MNHDDDEPPRPKTLLTMAVIGGMQWIRRAELLVWDVADGGLSAFNLHLIIDNLIV